MIGRVNTGGGGKGAALTVTAPAGSTVTVSKDGKSKRKVAGSDGIVVFKGLQSGTWTLSITDGTQTASKTVEIVADYATTITFFAATINITYPAGSTCTVTDGETTLMAPDTSGTWACVVPNAGTWTVSASGWKYSVIITNKDQVESVYLDKAYLYNNGDEYKSMTGGWSLMAKSYIEPGLANLSNASLTRNTDNLHIYRGGTRELYSCIATIANGVDLSKYTTLEINCKCSCSGSGSKVCLVLVDANTDERISYITMHATSEGADVTKSGTYRITIPEGAKNVKVALDLYHYSNPYYNGYAQIWMYSLHAY